MLPAEAQATLDAGEDAYIEAARAHKADGSQFDPTKRGYHWGVLCWTSRHDLLSNRPAAQRSAPILKV
jgi:hypothetical protein